MAVVAGDVGSTIGVLLDPSPTDESGEGPPEIRLRLPIKKRRGETITRRHRPGARPLGRPSRPRRRGRHQRRAVATARARSLWSAAGTGAASGSNVIGRLARDSIAMAEHGCVPLSMASLALDVFREVNQVGPVASWMRDLAEMGACIYSRDCGGAVPPQSPAHTGWLRWWRRTAGPRR